MTLGLGSYSCNAGNSANPVSRIAIARRPGDLWLRQCDLNYTLKWIAKMQCDCQNRMGVHTHVVQVQGWGGFLHHFEAMSAIQTGVSKIALQASHVMCTEMWCALHEMSANAPM